MTKVMLILYKTTYYSVTCGKTYKERYGQIRAGLVMHITRSLELAQKFAYLNKKATPIIAQLDCENGELVSERILPWN